MPNPLRTHRLLVVDDEPTVRDVVSRYLQRDGYEVRVAVDGPDARQSLADFRPDLVVLDIMLPGDSGLEILREIRQRGDLPVILLTARAEESDRLAGLELGADDYVVKPFSSRELTARVRSVLRRSTPRAALEELSFDGLTIDSARHEALVDGTTVELTAREFDLLLFLASSPGQVFSRGQLLEQVWESSTDWQDPATVTVHIRRLRQKIEVDPHNPRWVTTVWGVGYRFES
ncbi:MAG TPA: response regulator transcription factor [Acidimicrobiia bacterium]|nr:response regulator transcription factor [Acidimicrobiia bacterium]